MWVDRGLVLILHCLLRALCVSAIKDESCGTVNRNYSGVHELLISSERASEENSNSKTLFYKDCSLASVKT